MKKYNCPFCGAELYWDSNAGSLKCEYCDHAFSPDEFEDESEQYEKKAEQKAKAEAENPAYAGGALGDAGAVGDDANDDTLREANEQDKASDDSVSADLVVYECEHCGAEVVTAKSTVATTCAFCGRAITLSSKLVGNFKPDLLIPFKIDEKRAAEIYKAYCNGKKLTPKEFKSENVIKKLKGVYVPFWLHSFTVNADAVVYGENTHTTRRGDDKIIEHHKYIVNMDVSGDFKNIPTDGLNHLDDKLMKAIEPFDYSEMTDFNPAYMAGFYAEEYDVSDEETVSIAQERAVSTMKEKTVEAAGILEMKTVQTYNAAYENSESKYAMLPVWLFNVEYKGKDYQYAVNGETGKITGKLPLSVAKLIGRSIGWGVAVQMIVTLIMLIGG